MSDAVFFFGSLALAILLIGGGMWYFGVYKDYSGNKLPENMEIKTNKKENTDGV